MFPLRSEVRKMRSITIAVFGLALAASGSASALVADAAHGEKIARRWCAACHLVAPDQKEASADVAPFAAAARHKTNAELADFLTDPHPKMPNMVLSREEIADLVAYMRSLAPDGPAKPE
jgi:mono/diheme cytochrome c family protein